MTGVEAAAIVRVSSAVDDAAIRTAQQIYGSRGTCEKHRVSSGRFIFDAREPVISRQQIAEHVWDNRYDPCSNAI